MDDRFGIESVERASGIELLDWQQSRLVTYVRLLRSWQTKQNLVSRETLETVWSRHIADCVQLLPLIESTLRSRSDTRLAGVDLGSGAGLPGALLALVGVNPEEIDAFHMTLIESTNRKASFLRTVSRETNCSFDVLPKRIETFSKGPIPPAHFITARALAPLSRLITLAEPWLNAGSVAFFHKGGEYARELADWPDADAYHVVEHSSVVDPQSRILQIQRRDAE